MSESNIGKTIKSSSYLLCEPPFPPFQPLYGGLEILLQNSRMYSKEPSQTLLKVQGGHSHVLHQCAHSLNPPALGRDSPVDCA